MIDERVKLFKLLADKSRLKIVAMLMKEPMYIELLSERLKLNPSTVSFHLKKLEQASLVRSEKDQYYMMYFLDKEKLNFNLLKEIEEVASINETELQREEQYRKKIIDTFMVDGRLTQIPVQRKKRNVILDKIAEEFELGKEYPENEVNNIISQFNDDYCLIRREFIMEKMFTRDNGIYIKIK